MGDTGTVALRDAVLQTLRFEEPEICPYYIWIDRDMVGPLADHFGADQFVGPPEGARSFAGSYTIMREITAKPVSEEGDTYTDDYGVQYRRGSILHVERPALSAPSVKGYRFPDLTTDRHFEGLDEWLREHESRFRIVQLGMMFFERAWGMRGMDHFFMDMHEHPGFVAELMEGLEAVCLQVIDRLVRDYGDRFDAIGFSEDYGSQKGLMISPVHWREFIKPHLRRMFERIRSAGKTVYIHCCGDVFEVIPDLIEVGANILQPIQPEAMDVFEVKRRYGRDLCLVGGISTQQTLPYGTPDQVRDEVRQCLERLGEGGGYVMAPAKPILPGVPIGNAIALIETFVNQKA